MTDNPQVAIVCGGLGNPGRAITAELLRLGWSVVAQEPTADVESLAAELARESAAGERLAAYRADLGDQAQREDLVEFAMDQFARVDLLVCPPPPSTIRSADLLEAEAADVEAALAGGVLAPMFTAQRVANEMIRLIESETIDGGRIVFLGSLAAYTTSADQSAACLAAAGVDMLRRLFADRLGQYGINVYELRAGLMVTRHDEPGHEEYDQLIRDGLTPIRRWGRPRDLALAVSAVAQDMLGFSTGQVIHVDGGFHLRRLSRAVNRLLATAYPWRSRVAVPARTIRPATLPPCQPPLDALGSQRSDGVPSLRWARWPKGQCIATQAWLSHPAKGDEHGDARHHQSGRHVGQSQRGVVARGIARAATAGRDGRLDRGAGR